MRSCRTKGYKPWKVINSKKRYPFLNLSVGWTSTLKGKCYFSLQELLDPLQTSVFQENSRGTLNPGHFRYTLSFYLPGVSVKWLVLLEVNIMRMPRFGEVKLPVSCPVTYKVRGLEPTLTNPKI